MRDYKNRKTETISFRVSAEDKDYIYELADKLGMTASTLMWRTLYFALFNRNEKRVSLRLTEEEYERAAYEAEAQAMTLEEYFKDCAKNSI